MVYKNTNHIVTSGFSNQASEKLYKSKWKGIPELAAQHHEGKQCGGCSFFAPLNSDWGICCYSRSQHHLETVFEHFTCGSYVEEGWEAHSFRCPLKHQME
jgi:hypothetical protein